MKNRAKKDGFLFDDSKHDKIMGLFKIAADIAKDNRAKKVKSVRKVGKKKRG